MNRIEKQIFVLLLLGFVCISTFAFGEEANLNLANFPVDYPPAGHPFWSLQGQIVQVRGFWYPLSEEGGVLAAHPGIKSCCLAVPTKIYQQVIVKGALDSLPAKQVVTLEGVFTIKPLSNREGEMIQFYVLEQAKEVQRSAPYLLFFILGGGLCVGAIRLYRKFL